uniref:Uncharacterized protein n=1 Tax=viral metagenome TaxID=1070528 RepID=A0A6C0DWC7_9ZZZZ
MVLMYTIAVTKDKTTIYMKVPYDCLSYKQKMHRGISKLNLKKTLTSVSNALKKDEDEDKVELIQE